VVRSRSRSISSSEGFRDERKKRVKKKSENIRKEGSRTEEERDPCPKRRWGFFSLQNICPRKMKTSISVPERSAL
jgi:hypothetical protein